MKTRKSKLSVCISRDTLEKIEELARIVSIRNLGRKEKPVSISRLVEELVVSGLDHRGKELWKR